MQQKLLAAPLFLNDVVVGETEYFPIVPHKLILPHQIVAETPAVEFLQVGPYPSISKQIR
jgi:hypothetical protein